MASRVVVIGVNGAGKSTMIKLLIGELEPHEYEVQYVGCQNPIEENSWVAKDTLLKMKWTDPADKKRTEHSCESAMQKLMMQVDERIAFEQSGIATKKLTALNIQKHLDNFNLESQFG